MKKPIAIIFNDVHLKTGNEKAIIQGFKYMVKLATEKGIENLIFAGDLFDSRQFQRQSILEAFDICLNEVKEANLKLYMFAGNHDKTIYEDDYSFLEPFRHHPNVTLNNQVSEIEIDGVNITLMPFWSDDILIPKIHEHSGSDVLISHFEMEGSVDLDTISLKRSINKKMLSKWKKVYLGHFHNHVEITKDIVHLPSFMQNYFGEDSKKGFAILNDDLSYDLIKGHFREFKKLSIDIDKTTLGEIKTLIGDYKNSSMVIRFEFFGSRGKLDALDKSIFKDTGIDIKKKHTKQYDFNSMELEVPTIKEKYGKEDVENTFEQFCESKELDHSEGVVLLKEFFKNKGI